MLHDVTAPAVLRLSTSATNRLLGTRLQRDEMARLLSAIEFKIDPENEDVLKVAAPSFRVDVNAPKI
jgi:phenylalanyl-tRNA synthetase beta chain